jgi:hypothetical protein
VLLALLASASPPSGTVQELKTAVRPAVCGAGGDAGIVATAGKAFVFAER